MEKTTFHIEELCCVDEERAIRKELKKVAGIETMSFGNSKGTLNGFA